MKEIKYPGNLLLYQVSIFSKSLNSNHFFDENHYLGFQNDTLNNTELLLLQCYQWYHFCFPSIYLIHLVISFEIMLSTLKR